MLAAAGETSKAITALVAATKLNPAAADVWQMLSEQYALAGDDALASQSVAQHIRLSAKDPALIEAAVVLCDNKLADAERLLKAFLKSHPANVAAIRMLAEVAARLGRYGDAETLLARCLVLAPDFAVARHNYAIVLHRQNKSQEAIAQVDILLKTEPLNPAYRALKGAAYGQIGEYDRAIACYEDVLKTFPKQPKAWLSYGHALKAVGRQNDCIEAYKKCIALAPTLGEAWWSLANLKTFRFDDRRDRCQCATARARAIFQTRTAYHFDFSLGKALEDQGILRRGVRALRRRPTHCAAKVSSTIAEETSDHVRRSKALFTRRVLRRPQGRAEIPRPDPIFIVGLPRAGSTLHRADPGDAIPRSKARWSCRTSPRIARRLERTEERAASRPIIPRCWRPSTSETLARRLATEYLGSTRIQRKLGRPFFIDKMPNNFAHIGLIHLILPNAKIIDARRHPLGCCFSAFKQHFARGQAFSYDLTELGRYYADYVELMAHFDAVLPGRVHRVFYEQLVADPRSEMRRLLAYCGVPFEENCLRFYENERAVRTASSEQVRLPIFRDGVDQWRNFEPWLGPLKDRARAGVAGLPK